MNKQCVILAGTLALSSALAHADTYQYQADYFQGHSSGLIPGLDLRPNSLTLRTSDGLTDQYNLDSVTIGFEQNDSITVSGFQRLAHGGGYVAKLRNAWIFRELNVVVRPSGFNNTGLGHDVSVEFFLPDYRTMNDGSVPPDAGHILLGGYGPIHDVSPRKLADAESYKVDGKTLSLRLMDRLGQAVPPGMPVPGYESGFELSLNWLGHGTRRVFVSASMIPDQEFARYRAVALKVDEVPGPEGMDYMIAVEYEDLHSGARNLTPFTPLRDMLNQAFPVPM